MGRDWLLRGWWAGMECLSGLFLAMMRLCTLCFVVLFVGPIWDDVMFGYMHASKFWVFDTWTPAPCVNQAVLSVAHEESGNQEDGSVWDGWELRRSRQNVWGREPNTAAMHRAVPDGPSEGLSKGTNHAHGDRLIVVFWIQIDHHI
jgi:hypothetical protein